jgi:hypothetical protein
MKRELAEQFNREVDGYRNALLFYARKSDWEEFKTKAGRLFDYVESIEFSELERRFFKVFTPILAALGLAVLLLFGVDFEVHPEWMHLKNTFILSALATCSFEIYFYFDFRMYLGIKTSNYKKRRERFVRDIEQDFRSFALQRGSDAA